MRLSEARLLTDENIDFAVVTFLEGNSFDVLDVKRDGFIGTDDLTLLRLSVLQQRIVITHDSDFGTLAIAANEPYVGILYLRPGHIKPEFTIGSLQTVLAQDFDVTPPFIIVTVRTGNNVKIRVRQS